MEKVVEKPVRRIPHFVFVHPDPVHGIANPYEVLEVTERDLFIEWIVLSQYECDVQHGLAVERHPCSAVCLVRVAAGRQRRAAIENPDVVESEEPACEDVLSLRVLPVHPPIEILLQS